MHRVLYSSGMARALHVRVYAAFELAVSAHPMVAIARCIRGIASGEERTEKRHRAS